MCSIPECGKKMLARKLCKSHYEKWRKYGDPLGGGTHAQRSECESEKCEGRQYRWGLCGPHFASLNAYLKPPKEPRLRAKETGPRRPKGTGYLRPDGYLQLGGMHDHPTADCRGIVYVHRQVLYDAIGPGWHPCHWCGALVTWRKGFTTDVLVADHVDFDRSNNDRTNLVPSCNICNATRLGNRSFALA